MSASPSGRGSERLAAEGGGRDGRDESEHCSGKRRLDHDDSDRNDDKKTSKSHKTEKKDKVNAYTFI